MPSGHCQNLGEGRFPESGKFFKPFCRDLHFDGSLLFFYRFSKNVKVWKGETSNFQCFYFADVDFHIFQSGIYSRSMSFPIVRAL